MHAVAAAQSGVVTYYHPEGRGSGLAGMKATHHDFAKLQREAAAERVKLVSEQLWAVRLHTIVQLAGIAIAD